jgi:hypothetical protein
MDTLKWIGSVILSIIGVCIVVGIGFAISTFGAIIATIGMIGIAIALVASLIKSQLFDKEE